MGNPSKRASLCFCGRLFGRSGEQLVSLVFRIKRHPGIVWCDDRPSFSLAWLYPRIVWGGLWGLLFLLPVMKNRFLSRGLLFSLGPTLVQLFIVFPMKAHKGVMGLTLGTLTPAFIFFIMSYGAW